MPKTAVVILNWNGADFLRQFLHKLLEFTPDEEAEIIIADNASTDDSVIWLNLHHPSIRIIQLDKNYGFAGGYNEAISQCEHEHILLLNSDVEVTKNWLQPLLKAIKDKETAAVMPKILSFNNREEFEYAGASGGFIDKYGYPFCRGRLFDHLETDKGQHNNSIEVFWTTGACMLIKREIFTKAGGFDADFFAHMEEIDLCWRLQRMGMKLKVVPESHVFHVGGGTLSKESTYKLFLNYRNNLFLLYKNLPDKRVFRIIFARMILDGASALMYLFKGQGKLFTTVFKAHIKFHQAKAQLRKKRQNNPVNETPLTGMYSGSIVLAYFIRRKKKFQDLNL